MVTKFLFTAFITVCISTPSSFADNEIKETAGEIKATFKKAGRGIKKEAKRGAGTVKKEFKSAKQKLKESL